MKKKTSYTAQYATMRMWKPRNLSLLVCLGIPPSKS